MAERLNVHYPLSIKYRVAYMLHKVYYSDHRNEESENDVRRKRFIIFYFFLFVVEGGGVAREKTKITSGVAAV